MFRTPPKTESVDENPDQKLQTNETVEADPKSESSASNSNNNTDGNSIASNNSAGSGSSGNKGPGKLKMTSTITKVEFPPYTPGQEGGIQTWLRQVEMRLKIAGITTENGKYEYMVAALPAEIVARVYDLINVEPETEPYKTLVTRIKKEFQPSDSEQVTQLLRGLKRGDKKPSLFLREMRNLAKDRVGDLVLRELFLAELPPSIADILTVIETKDTESLAVAADKAWERETLQKKSVAATSAVSSDPLDARVEALMQKMDRMIEAFGRRAVDDQHSYRRRPRSQTPGRRNQRGRSSSGNRKKEYTTCWYHYKFGEKSTKCLPWCEKFAEFSKKEKSSEN